MPAEPPWKYLDKGIVDLVRFLFDNGYETTDSGDGVSKPDVGREFDFPHVVVSVEPTDLMHSVGFVFGLLAGTEWAHFQVEGRYALPDGVANLMVYDARFVVSDD